MSDNIKPPAKFWLVEATKKRTANIPRVTSVDLYKASSSEFEPTGLFSTEIFGEVTSPERMVKRAVIDLGSKFITPMVYKGLVNAAPFSMLVTSKKNYRFDEETKWFIEDDSGRTGLMFLLEHISEVKIPLDGASSTRANFAKLLDTYRDTALLVEEVFVIPAGMRDVEVNKNGMLEQDEINNIYRNIIRVASSLPKKVPAEMQALYEEQFVKQQNNLVVLYDYIAEITDGKKKFTRFKYASRKVHGVTRNILTSTPSDTVKRLHEDRLQINQVQLPIYQFIKSVALKAAYHISSSSIVTQASDTSGWTVTDKQTLKARPADTLEEFHYQSILGTHKAVLKLINTFKTQEIRELPIGKSDSYLGLIYDNPDDVNVIVNNDIDNFPSTLDKKFIRPITLSDLLVISCFNLSDGAISITTRYPVDNTGSTQVNHPYVVTTIGHRKVKVTLPDDTTVEIKRFPADKLWINGVTTHSSAQKGHGSDHDGDALTTVTLLGKEAVAQGSKLIDVENLDYLVGPDGTLKFSPSDIVVDMLFHSLG